MNSYMKNESEEIAKFRVQVTELVSCLLKLKDHDLADAYEILKTLLFPHLSRNVYTNTSINSDFESILKSIKDNEREHQLLQTECERSEKLNNNYASIDSTIQSTSSFENHQNVFDYHIPYNLDFCKDTQCIDLLKNIDGKKVVTKTLPPKPLISTYPDACNSGQILDLCSKGKFSADKLPDNKEAVKNDQLFQYYQPCKTPEFNDNFVEENMVLVQSAKIEEMNTTNYNPLEEQSKCSQVLNDSDKNVPSLSDDKTVLNEINIGSKVSLQNEYIQNSEVLDLARKKESNPHGSDFPESTKAISDLSTFKINCNDTENFQSNKSLHCNLCNWTFTKKIAYEVHIDAHKRNRCTLCKSEFTRQKDLKAHMKEKHNRKFVDKEFPCQFCDRKFMKRSSLYYHINIHLSDSQKICQKCGEIFDNEENFKNHTKEHLKKAFHCNLCDGIFLRRQQYNDHIKAHNKNKCEYCEMSFSTKKNLFKHSRNVHKKLPQNISLDKKYKCEKCGKIFGRPSSLHLHMKQHLGLLKIECNLCNKNFNHRRSLLKHLKSLAHEHQLLLQNDKKVQSNNLNGEFACELCDLRLSSQQLLRRHCVIAHKGETKRHKCPHCNYKGKTATLLNRHIEGHIKRKKFICEFCGKAFNEYTSLKGHYIFVHSEVRAHKCTECNKAFKSKSGLVRHSQIHSAEPPHRCECGSRYNNISNLKRHIQNIHSSDKKKSKIHKEIRKENSLLPVDETCFAAPAVASMSQSSAVTAEETIRENGDFLIVTDSATPDSSPHFAVLEPQLLHLIPSTLQLTQENLHTVSFDGSELHALSIAPHYTSATAVLSEESFNVSSPQNEDAAALGHHNLQTPLSLQSISQDNINTSVFDFPVVSNAGKIRSVNKEETRLDLDSMNDGEINFVSSQLQELVYSDGTETNSLPTNYIVPHTLNNEILHGDMIL